jgi:hypothetical protein
MTGPLRPISIVVFPGAELGRVGTAHRLLACLMPMLVGGAHPTHFN